MSLLRLTVPIVLEPPSRPAPEAVAAWFESRIRRYEQDSGNPDKVTDIDVTTAAHGFDVHIESSFHSLPRVLPIVAFGVAAVLVQEQLPRLLLTATCFGVLGLGFAISWLKLYRFAHEIAADVRQSYSAVPPPANSDSRLPIPDSR